MLHEHHCYPNTQQDRLCCSWAHQGLNLPLTSAAFGIKTAKNSNVGIPGSCSARRSLTCRNVLQSLLRQAEEVSLLSERYTLLRVVQLHMNNEQYMDLFWPTLHYIAKLLASKSHWERWKDEWVSPYMYLNVIKKKGCRYDGIILNTKEPPGFGNIIPNSVFCVCLSWDLSEKNKDARNNLYRKPQWPPL